MKGIFIKDWYLIKSYLSQILFTVIVISILYFYMKVPFKELLVALLTMITFTNIYVEQIRIEKEVNFDLFTKILPIKPENIVKSKYILAFVNIILILVIALCFSIFVKEEHQFISQVKYLYGYTFMFSFGLVYFAILYPIIFLMADGRMLIFFINIVSMLLSAIINTIAGTSYIIINNFISDYNTSILTTGVINIIVALVLYFTSYKICVFRYKKISM